MSGIFGSKKKATQAPLTGYNYLTSGSPYSQFIGQGVNAGQNLGQYTNTGVGANQQAGALLNVGGTTPQAQQAAQGGFQNYLNSTGYQFQLGQGTDAITNSAAARGMLDSGSTLKSLAQYGQGLAGQYFNNYLGQLNSLSTQGLSAGQSNVGAGVQAGGSIGNAGTYGGAQSAQYANEANPVAGGISNLIGAGLGFFGL